MRRRFQTTECLVVLICLVCILLVSATYIQKLQVIFKLYVAYLGSRVLFKFNRGSYESALSYFSTELIFYLGLLSLIIYGYYYLLLDIQNFLWYLTYGSISYIFSRGFVKLHTKSVTMLMR